MKSVLSIILLICPFILFASDWPGTELPNEVADNKLICLRHYLLSELIH